MGELSFNFVPTTEPQYLAQFKYWFQHSIKYTFAYRRYISLSDTSIFNSPVAITKVATGLSDLYDLFVDKLAHPTIYKELAKNVYKVPYNINISMDEQSIIKQNHDFKLLDSYDIEKINSSDISIFHSNINASTHTKSLNICRNTNVSPQTNILNEYINTYWGLVENKLYIDKNNELQKINGSNFDIYKVFCSFGSIILLLKNPGTSILVKSVLYNFSSIILDNFSYLFSVTIKLWI